MDDKHAVHVVDLGVISTDTQLQMREKLSPDTVAEYKQLLIDATEQAKAPDEPIWPFSEPVEICIVNGQYLTTDGNHRIQAAREAGWQWIRAVVIDGTMQDALIAACGANAAHGLQRSNADKRRAC